MGSVERRLTVEELGDIKGLQDSIPESRRIPVVSSLLSHIEAMEAEGARLQVENEKFFTRGTQALEAAQRFSNQVESLTATLAALVGLLEWVISEAEKIERNEKAVDIREMVVFLRQQITSARTSAPVEAVKEMVKRVEVCADRNEKMADWLLANQPAPGLWAIFIAREEKELEENRASLARWRQVTGG